MTTDATIDDAPTVRVRPWIGALYERPPLLPYRTLILGESNYTKPENYNDDLVVNCVKDAIEGTDAPGFGRFSTKIIRIIYGPESTMQAETFWQQVAFFNFVERLVGDQARQRPSPSMWAEPIGRFHEITSALKPERMLVLGKANWRNLLSLVAHRRIDEYTSALEISDGSRVLAGYTNHPSSSLRYTTWCPIVRTLLF